MSKRSHFAARALTFALLAMPWTLTGQVQFCFGGFTILSPSATPEDLVSGTYAGLWDELGGNRLSPEAVEQILSSKDPFTIPEERDVASLRTHIKKLEAMVMEKSWNTPEVRDRVLRDIAARAAGAEQAGIAIKKAKVRTGPPIVLDTGGQNDYFLLPPDGRIIAVGLRGRLTTVPDVYYDPATGQTEKRPPREESAVAFRLSADGTEAYVSYFSGIVYRVPYRNGFLQWKSAKKIDPGDRVTRPDAPFIFQKETSGQFLLAGRHEGPTKRYNLKTGEVTALDLSAAKMGRGSGGYSGWGLLPGTNTVYVTASSKNKAYFRRFSLDEKGKLQPVEQTTELDIPNRPEFILRPDGSGFIVHQKNGISLLPAATLRPVPILSSTALPPGHEIELVALGPNGSDLFVLAGPPKSDGRDRVLRVDIQTGAIKADVGLPAGGYRRLPEATGGYRRLEPMLDGRVLLPGYERNLIVVVE